MPNARAEPATPCGRAYGLWPKTNHFRVLAAAVAMLAAVGLLVLLLVVEAGPAEATLLGKNGRIALEISKVIYTIKVGGEK